MYLILQVLMLQKLGMLELALLVSFVNCFWKTMSAYNQWFKGLVTAQILISCVLICTW